MIMWLESENDYVMTSQNEYVTNVSLSVNTYMVPTILTYDKIGSEHYVSNLELIFTWAKPDWHSAKH